MQLAKPYRLRETLKWVITAVILILTTSFLAVKINPKEVVQFVSPLIQSSMYELKGSELIQAVGRMLPHEQVSLCITLLELRACPGTLDGFEFFKIIFHDGCQFFIRGIRALANERQEDLEELYDGLARVLTDQIRPCAVNPNCNASEELWSLYQQDTSAKRWEPLLDLLSVSFIALMLEGKANSGTALTGFPIALKEFAKRVADTGQAKQILETYGPLPFANMIIEWPRLREFQTIDPYLNEPCRDDQLAGFGMRNSVELPYQRSTTAP